MKTEQPILITSVLSTADLSSSKNLFIGFDGAVCAAGVKPLGVLNANTNDAEQAPVLAIGVALVYSGAAVSLGDAVESDAAGKAITNVAGVIAGYARSAASGADELIAVLLS